MSQPPLILASTSPYRRQLLERLGLPFSQQTPDCDEDAVKATGHPPRQLAQLLAQMKAASVADGHPEAVVIGSDQLAAVDDRILGKPGSAEAAVEQLLSLQGRSHVLFTAVCVQHGSTISEHLDRTVLHMRPLGRAALERYVARDRPLDCAGAYKLEAAGICLFERIESEDHSAITGLPLLAMTRMLSTLGFVLP